MYSTDEDKIYVTDFIKREMNQENIWKPGQEYLKIERKKEKINKLIIIVLILLIIAIIGTTILSVAKAGL